MPMFSGIASKLHGESNALYRLRDELKALGSTELADAIESENGAYRLQ